MYYLLPILFSLLQPEQPLFKAQTIDSAVSIGYGVAIGDVDGDGKPDILLADQKQFVWYRNGDWKKFVLIENLTQHDNVCITARDVTGDGKVEVAVGAQWNPAETSDTAASGSVHVLVAPADVTQRWQAVRLYHEPTVHRMRWVQAADGRYSLAVLPLHGIGNKDGIGKGVNILLYRYPELFQNPMPHQIIQTPLHLTHNFTTISDMQKGETIGVASKEGLLFFKLPSGNDSVRLSLQNVTMKGMSAGELRHGQGAGEQSFTATIEPMHGTNVVVYKDGYVPIPTLLDSNLKEGHALAVADFKGTGYDQIAAGWRAPNGEGKVGIKLYTRVGNSWTSEWIDEAGMACEDIQVADLNGDGKPDIVASGRSTHNLKIYWNQSRR